MSEGLPRQHARRSVRERGGAGQSFRSSRCWQRTGIDFVAAIDAFNEGEIECGRLFRLRSACWTCVVLQLAVRLPKGTSGVAIPSSNVGQVLRHSLPMLICLLKGMHWGKRNLGTRSGLLG